MSFSHWHKTEQMETIELIEENLERLNHFQRMMKIDRGYVVKL